MATIVAASGGGNWSSTATWTGGVTPTAADDVQLSAASGSVTIDVNSFCRSLDCTGYTATLTHASAVTLSIGDATAGAGNNALKLVSGMTYTKGNVSSSAFSFVSTSATVQTIDSGTKTLGNMVFNATSNGSWQLVTSLTIATAATVTLTKGTLDTNSQTCSWGYFSSSNANVRSLTLGSSAITLTGSSGSHWDAGTPTNFTFNAGTSAITFNFTSTINFNGGNLTYYDVTFNFPAGVGANYTGSNSYHNLTLSATTNTYNPLNIQSGTTQTISGTFTATANTANNRIRLFSGTTGTATTINAAAVVLSYVDFMDITAAGAGAPFTGTSLGDEGGCSNITFTTPVTRYRVGAGGGWASTANWATTSGGAGGQTAPLAQDTVFIDANATGSISLGGLTTNSPLGKHIDFTGFTGTFQGGIGSLMVFGNFTFGAGMTVDVNMSIYFGGRGSYTITSNGKAFNGTVSIQAPGGTYTLQDSLVNTNSTIAMNAGTFVANSFNVTCGTFNASGSVTRAITMGSGTWTVTGTGTVWNFGTDTNCTLTPGTSTLVVSDTSSSTKTVTMGGATATLNNLTITGGGTGSVTLGGSTTRTFKTVTIGAPKTIIIPAGVTRVITGNFNATGSAGNLISIISSSAGSAATLSKSTGTVSCDYLSLQDSTATGGVQWYAGSHSTNVSNNTGWIFTDAPSGGMLLMGVS